LDFFDLFYDVLLAWMFGSGEFAFPIICNYTGFWERPPCAIWPNRRAFLAQNLIGEKTPPRTKVTSSISWKNRWRNRARPPMFKRGSKNGTADGVEKRDTMVFSFMAAIKTGSSPLIFHSSLLTRLFS